MLTMIRRLVPTPARGYFFTLLVLAVLTLFQRWPQADDPLLIRNALTHPTLGPDWGPLYAVLLRGLRALVGEHYVYRSARLCVTLAFGVSLFQFFNALMREDGWKPALLLILSPVSPAVAYYASVPSSIAVYLGASAFLWGWYVVLSARGGMWQASGLVLVAAASLCRPEFLASSLFMASYLLLTAKGGRWQVVGWLLVSTVPWLVFGLPLPNADRSEMAFGQHFALRHCQVPGHCEGLNSWADWRQIVQAVFGEVAGPTHLLTTSPATFAHHVGANALQFLLCVFSAGYALCLFIKYKLVSLLPGFAYFFAILFASRRERGATVISLSGLREHGAVVLALVSCALPFVLACVLFYPRVHYLLVPVVVSTVLFSLSLKHVVAGR